MSRLLTYGIIQQKRKVDLGFETYVAPEGFDPAAQDVNIYSVFNAYYKTNINAKFIYSVTTTGTLTQTLKSGTSYRYGYTSGGVDYTIDTGHTTIRGGYSAGAKTSIPVNDVTGFAATGTIQVGAGSYFIYTSLDTTPGANAFVGASQSMAAASAGVLVDPFVTWTGTTKRWVIVNNTTGSGMTAAIGSNVAVWLYCGPLINCAAQGVNFTNLKYIHCDDLDAITSYPYASHPSSTGGLTGVLYISRNAACTTISSYTFTGCVNIIGTLTIPSNITTIANAAGYTTGAFYNCKGLTGISFENGVISIGLGAFSVCSNITGTLTIPNSVTTIEVDAFRTCSKLSALSLGNSLTTINTRAFYDCSLMTGELSIPSTLTSLGVTAFYNTNFTSITNSASGFEVSDNVLYDKTVGGQIKANYSAKGYSGTLTLKSDTTVILDYCFYNNTLRTGALVIPDTVTEIKQYGCSLLTGMTSTLTLETSSTVLATLGNYAFSDVRFTGTLTLPASVTTLGTYCFYLNRFTAISSSSTNYPSSDNVLYDEKTAGVVAAYANAQSYSGTLTLKVTTTKINAFTFYTCTARNGALTIPDTVTLIDTFSFRGCTGFTSLVLETTSSSLVTIGAHAFNGDTGMVGTLVIPNSVTTINGQAFYNCRFNDITIGSGVTTFGAGSDWGDSRAFSSTYIVNSITILTTSFTNTNPFLGCSNVGQTSGGVVLPANYSGTYLTFNFSNYLSADTLNQSIINITSGTKTVTIGATNKARLLASYPNAVTDAAARGITVN